MSESRQDSADGARRGLAAWPIALLVAVLLGSVWLWLGWLARDRAASAAFPMTTGRLGLPGVAAPIEVLRDRRGIPHIDAARQLDAWAGLGFVHAQDRLGQMLWLRRVVRGRSAEVVGEAGLASDKLARTLGIGLHGDAQVDRLEPGTRRVLEAYASGVNARMARIVAGAVAPPVGVIIDEHGLEPWTPGDCLALVKLVSWSSGARIETSLVLLDLIERLGGLAARPFFPTGGRLEGADVPVLLPVPRPDLVVAPRGGRLPPASPTRQLDAISLAGSSAWVIAGGSTENGAPLLAADLHLPATAPSLVYEAHLRGGDLDLSGATIPGIPLVWAGRNRYVAWAAVPGRVATADLHRETVRPAHGDSDRMLYRAGSRWVAVEERIEIISVRGPAGAMREEMLRVRATRHGPLINPLLDRDREPLAIAWTGAQPGDGMTALLTVARSRTADDIVEALREHHEPVITVVYADRDGQVGVQLAGWIPSRALPTSLVPVPGRLRTFDARGRIDFDRLPGRRLGRARGWLISADNLPREGLGGPQIDWLWLSGTRARRIGQILRETGQKAPFDLRRAAAPQNDLVAMTALEVIESLRGLALDRGGRLSAEAQEVAVLLERWNGEMASSSPGAAAYRIFLDHLVDELFAEPLGRALLARYRALPLTDCGSIAERLVLSAARGGGGSGAWTDPERVGPAVRRSLQRAWVSLSYRLGPNRERWDWGRLHQLAFRPFAALNGNGSIGRGLGPFPLGGDAATLLYAKSAPAHRFSVRAASTYRLAVDLASPDQMLTALAPGQSEHPNHPHFDDGVEPWLDGRWGLLTTSRLLIEEISVDRLVLEPAS